MTAVGKTSAEVEVQRGIFQGDALSSFLFLTVLILLNHIFRKYSEGYTFSKSQEKIDCLMYMGDIKLFAKNEKESENLIERIRICN